MKDSDIKLKDLLERRKNILKDLESKEGDRTFEDRIGKRRLMVTEDDIIKNIEEPTKKPGYWDKIKKMLGSE